jgi:TonB-linked SusC/RagA family outer membrane protein
MHLSAIARSVSCMNGTTRKIIWVMNLTAVLLLTASLQLAARTHGQTVTLKLRDAPMKEVFRQIQKQTGLDVLIDEALLKKAGRVTLDVRNMEVNDVLDLCLKNEPLSYKIIDGRIVVKQKPPSTGYLYPSAEALAKADIDVSGRVTDADGNPLEAATIKVKGTNIVTTTNSNGEFQLAGISENATLEISYVGYETYTVAVNNKTNIAASLKIKPESLNEVIINKGYYTEKQKYSVGNVMHIDSKVIEQQPVQNPILALHGRVPGLFITQQSGVANGDVKFRIQGQNSIAEARNEPLVVIDGVPIPAQFGGTSVNGPINNGGTPLSYINPADIESIDILKDADATAIYGSRAANGAILITTKKGKVGKTKVNINLQQGWGKVTRKVNMLNSRQYLDMRYEAYRNDGISLSSLTPGFRTYDLTLWDTTRQTDWQKTLIGGTAQYTNINASVSGGTPTMQYLVGGTYNRQTTVFPIDMDDERGSVHFNLNGASSNQKFRIQLSGSYLIDQNRLPRTDLTASAIRLEPVAPPLYKSDGTLNWQRKSDGGITFDNPLQYFYSDYNNNTKNLIASASMGYRILPSLELKSSLSYTNLQSNSFLPIPSRAIRPDDLPTTPLSADFLYRNMNTWIIEPQLAYSRIIGKGELESMLGTTIQKSVSDLLILNGSGFSSDILLKNLAAAPNVRITTFSNGMYRYNALFGRLNFKWDKKYMVNLTARRDGSSRFGDKNKFHNFGSAGLGWIFTQEKFLQHVGPLSFGKLRVSYGTTGNDQIGDYTYLSRYNNTFAGIPYQNTVGLQASGLPNPYLQWEETRKWQAGIELGFLGDRILLNSTYARNRCSNQLTSVPLPSITGFSFIGDNLPATVQNISWEFLLNTVNFTGKKINWTSSINLTIPNNKLISFPDFDKSFFASGFSGVIVGQPLGVIKTWHSAGVDPATGYYQVYNKDGHTIKSSPDYPTDYINMISTLPKLYGGFQNSITWKNFQFDFLFQFVRQKGFRDLFYWNNYWQAGTFGSGNSNQPVSVLNRWQKPGDATSISRFNSNNSVTPWPYGDAYTYAASYIRLKNVALSWQIPQNWQQKMNLQAGSIYFNGENLATITKYSGLDPENQSSSSLPPLQVWTVGIKLGF